MNFTGYRRAALCVATALALASPAFGQAAGGGKGPKLNKEDLAFAKQVNDAIDKGVKYLTTLPVGSGDLSGAGLSLRVGATALAGLALLEGGVDPSDKSIQDRAALVREKIVNETYNYSVTLAIMFLDRLGDPQDTPIIQSLGVRVLAGQNPGQAGGQRGGWSYHLPAPDAQEQQRLKSVIENRKAAGKPLAIKDRKALSPKDLPKEITAQLQRLAAGKRDPVGASDNSNTQFALLALWCARRHGLPVEGAYAAAEQRLRVTQFPANGGWSYQPPGGSPDLQMTCCGLIGLALAEGTNKSDPARDRAIYAGLEFVTRQVGSPVSDPSKIPRILERLPGGGKVQVYYTLWTLERMCVLYDLTNLKGKDWHKWGAQLLVANQKADGSWRGSYAADGCDTAFSLLFLRRTNLTYELTKQYKKSKTKLQLRKAFSDPPDKSSSLSPPRNRDDGGALRGDWRQLVLAGTLGPRCADALFRERAAVPRAMFRHAPA
jgi:hypothetical protein